VGGRNRTTVGLKVVDAKSAEILKHGRNRTTVGLKGI